MSLRSNPDARVYSIVAGHRLEDARILLQNARPNGGAYLAGFAVECILKALILSNTTPRERPAVLTDLKTKFGHDLDALRKEAARRGLHMGGEEMEQFRRVNTWDNEHRYDARIQSMREAEALLRAAAAVIDWAERVGG